MKNNTLIVIISVFLVTGHYQMMAQKDFKNPIKKIKSKDWVSLLDQNLSEWEVWTGVPEPSVKNLPKNYQKDENGANKAPIGLGDPMGIFSVTEDENGELILNISGEVYAGLTSKKEYANYHLTFLFRWGERKYEPRLERKRDNGLLYHCHGEHGAFWNVWKSSLEFQIQEGDFGDLYTLAGTKAKVTVDEEGKWSDGSNLINNGVRVKRKIDVESPHGQWTRVDLYVLGDSSAHVVNGNVVLALTDAISKEGNILDSGQLQIQSESAECYIKDMHLRPISKFPKWIDRELP
ncbi:hypothetical protein GCM10011414_21020 [Croceivirga lutea]|uniref:3-keto-disaccharide hydrolase n=1 Tax=Croceivirga lutea TaxID=1775167 RepID=UPI00163ABDD3|nr:DUF1080 domain-containing protein [Croceivirga lutea]GGG51261.1 hypothetical protein GCM10011414_21020 [Croceivirga lutea]